MSRMKLNLYSFDPAIEMDSPNSLASTNHLRRFKRTMREGMASSLQNVSRLVPVIAHAVGVFGDERKATHWLSTPLPFFGNRAPQDMLETDEGIALVEQTLTRIEHNIPS